MSHVDCARVNWGKAVNVGFGLVYDSFYKAEIIRSWVIIADSEKSINLCGALSKIWSHLRALKILVSGLSPVILIQI